MQIALNSPVTAEKKTKKKFLFSNCVVFSRWDERISKSLYYQEDTQNFFEN